MISVEEAKKLVVKHSKTLSTEKLSLYKSFGYVLAKDVYSPISLPPFNQSGMDGYAFIYDDLVNNNNITIVGEVAAGKVYNKKLKKGQAVRIFTGAAVPEGADTVVMQEKVTVENNSLKIQDTLIKKGANIRLKSSQINKGELAVSKGTLLNAGAIGYLTGMGLNTVTVFRKPKVSVIVTGSELQKPGTKLKKGNIYESNTYSLIAALQSINIEPVTVQCVSDNELKVYKLIEKAVKKSDVVLLSGGISVGDYDFVGSALMKMKAKNIFYKVKQKPGKPLFFGKHKRALIFALPGNPAAVLTCFYYYVYPAIRQLQGNSNLFLKSLKLPIQSDYNKKKGLSNFLKSRIENNHVVPLEGQESYKLSSFAIADSMIYLPEDVENIKSGTLVDVLILP